MTPPAVNAPAVVPPPVSGPVTVSPPAVSPAPVPPPVGGMPPTVVRLFATREGLVGKRTANGHVIVKRDHFVALPSRRGLNPNDRSRDYLVRVCYVPTGRCETAPVWDVGPWNIRDDYWNTSSVREMWWDLPQGKPQSQAAFQEGYNNGKDDRGRVIRNAAVLPVDLRPRAGARRGTGTPPCARPTRPRPRTGGACRCW